MDVLASESLGFTAPYVAGRAAPAEAWWSLAPAYHGVPDEGALGAVRVAARWRYSAERRETWVERAARTDVFDKNFPGKTPRNELVLHLRSCGGRRVRRLKGTSGLFCVVHCDYVSAKTTREYDWAWNEEVALHVEDAEAKITLEVWDRGLLKSTKVGQVHAGASARGAAVDGAAPTRAVRRYHVEHG